MTRTEGNVATRHGTSILILTVSMYTIDMTSSVYEWNDCSVTIIYNK